MIYFLDLDFRAQTEQLKTAYTKEEVDFLLRNDIFDAEYFDSIFVDENENIHRRHYINFVSEVRPIYSHLCDLLDIDFYSLALDISNKRENYNLQDWLSVFSNYNFLARDISILRNLFQIFFSSLEYQERAWISASDIPWYYESVVPTIMYVDEMAETEKLRNPDMYAKFINTNPTDDAPIYYTTPGDFTLETTGAPWYLFCGLPGCPEFSNLKDKITFRKEIFNDFFSSLEQKANSRTIISNSLSEFCTSSMYTLLQFNNIVKKCTNCGRYFVPPFRADTMYCNNPSPQDSTKTCKEYGAIKTYQENLKNNEAMGLYRKIYMSKQMLAKRNPDIQEYQDSFQKYKEQSKQWKANVKAGIKSEEEYLAWLKQVKEKKVL